MMSSGTDDDDDLFRQVLGDAKPLKRARPVPEHPALKAGRKEVAKPAPKPRPALRKPVMVVPVAPRPKPTPDLATGDVTGMDRRTADRFRRGKMPIDARLDLHLSLIHI